jgi:hypothetical protein
MWTNLYRAEELQEATTLRCKNSFFRDQHTTNDSLIILDGKLYYIEPISLQVSSGPINCVTLRTGNQSGHTDICTLFGLIWDHELTSTESIPLLFHKATLLVCSMLTGTPLFNVTVPRRLISFGTKR